MACGVVAMVIELKAFDKGPVFVKDTDILLSGDKWTIVLNIALDDYTFLIEDMSIFGREYRCIRIRGWIRLTFTGKK
jgi:hypothetical protein